MPLTKITLPNGALFNTTHTFLGAGNLLTPGTVYYVNSATGSNDNNGTDPSTPKSTIAGAQSAATASKGDVVVIMPAHAETLTSALTLSKAGINYVGLGQGNLRPTLTGNGTIDAVSITAANVTLQNINFAAPETDDQTAHVNVAAAGATLRGLRMIGSQTSKNVTDMITVASGGDDLLVEDCVAYNTVVDCVSWLSLEAAVARPVIRGNVVMGQFSTGVLMDEATATLCYINANVLKNTKAATAVVTFTTGNSTGVMTDNRCSGRHTTIASNIVPGTGMDFFENYVVEEAALNGLYIPAQDAD
jgi:hypothetical protein